MKLLLARTLCLLPALLFGPAQAQSLPQDESAAVILAYYRVGEDVMAESNIALDLFKSHIEFLSNPPYTVLPLPEVVAALQNGEKLPDHAAVITFEGAYTSAMENAFPLLIEKNMPFTVFYSSAQSANKNDGHLNWEELQRLSQNKLVTLGMMPASYIALPELPAMEIQKQINKAQQDHRTHFGAEGKLFSYPFGAYNQDIKQILQDKGISAAFGQHSGAAYAGMDLYALPRFTLTDRFGDMDRFKMIVDALPLPVSDIEPQNPVLTQDHPVIGFSVDKNLQTRLAQLSCYISGQSQPDIQILGARAEIRIRDDIVEDKIRMNCTMPGPDRAYESDPQRWRWFGMLLANQTASKAPSNPARDGLHAPQE